MAKAIQAYTLPELMTRIEEIFNANPDPIKGFEAIVQYDIHGEEEGTYQHIFHDGTLSIKEGIQASPNVTMVLSYDNFKSFY
ncbi:hypothetical protein V7161_22315 [Neobacillus drentensis]|uniref:SCP2 sterol-binding domain-containing protein n=1 Tax=Neobacillus drentensis TaxID=220684 RepID=UPI0030017CA0